MTDRKILWEEMKLEVYLILSSVPEISLTDFKAKFIELMEKPLPYSELGCVSDIDYMRAICDTVRISWTYYDYILEVIPDKNTETFKRLPREEQYLKPENISPLVICRPTSTAKVNNRWSSAKRRRTVSMTNRTEVGFYIQRMLKYRDTGMRLENFAGIFKTYTGLDMDFKVLGFLDLETFLISLQDMLPLVFYFSRGGKRMVRLSHDASKPFETAENPLSLRKVFPGDVVLPGVNYSEQELPSRESEETSFPIYTTAITNPGSVWIQLNEKCTAGILSKLEYKMNTLYQSEEGNNYTIHDEHAIVGAAAAGIWDGDGHWHRIRISSVLEKHVKVVFVDSGYESVILKTSLKYLKSWCMELPAQGIKTRLAFLAPKGPGWNIAVTEKLKELCNDRLLMAKLVDCPSYKDTSSIWLFDCNEMDIVDINRLLIFEKYAKWYNEYATTKPIICDYSPSDASYLDVESTSATWALSPSEDKTQASGGRRFDPVNCFTPTREYAAKNPLSFGEYRSKTPFLEMISIPCTSPRPHSSQQNFASQSSLLHTGKSTLTLHEHQRAMGKVFNHERRYVKSTIENGAAISMHSGHIDETAVGTSNSSGPRLSSNRFSQHETFLYHKESVLKGDDFLRVDLKFGYRMHIIVEEGIPCVSVAEISRHFWPFGSELELLNKISWKLDSIPLKVLRVDNKSLLKQLTCLGVKELLKKRNGTYILVFLLEDVKHILNKFGHPSPTIRTEIRREFEQFDDTSDVWKTFTKPPRDELARDIGFETAAAEFAFVCAHELKRIVLEIEKDIDMLKKIFPKDAAELKRLIEWRYFMNARIDQIRCFSAQW